MTDASTVPLHGEIEKRCHDLDDRSRKNPLNNLVVPIVSGPMINR